MKLTVDHLNKSYGQTQVLTDVSFEIEPAGIVGLLGRNGAGKSTLLKIIAGQIQQDSGSVKLSNEAVDLDISVNMGYMSERNPLYNNLYVKEYLSWIEQSTGRTANKSWKSEIMKKVGLEQVSTQRISTLSKGYRQRVGLAAALMRRPNILILDEPVNGFDPEQILEFRSLIQEEAKDKIVILSSHVMQEIEAVCSRVIFIEGGRIKKDMEIDDTDQLVELFRIGS